MSTTKEQRILVLAPFGRDGPLARQVIGEAGLEAQTCASVAELCAELEEGAGAVLLTEEVLAVPQARAFLGYLERQPAWSDLPVIVFGASDASLGESANVTLLDRPVRIRTLVSAVRAALRARNRQYQSRNLLHELQRSVQDRDQFLAMLGHELRNPLAAILTASELLDLEAGTAHSRLRAVIGRQVRHLGRLVDDLLDVARITTGKISLHLAPVDLEELVARTVQPYEEEARRRGLTLTTRGYGRPLTLRADLVRVEQVVGNILANAIKYTPPGGRIDLETGVEGGAAILRVRDTGVGISAEMLPRIFDLFAQAPGTLDRAQGGMGIGLTLVQRLVSLHGGTVAARSEGAGKGSEFEVRLPLAQAEERIASPGKRFVAARAYLVMLAEDNPDSREVLQLALEQLGLRVAACGDGVSAVQRALAEKPEAMIVDLGLPGKDGYQVARDVRAALGTGVRLIALTGYGQPEDRLRAEEAGFDAFLTKPVEMDKILSALSR